MESIPRGMGWYESVLCLVLCVLCNDQLSMSHFESDCNGNQSIVESFVQIELETRKFDWLQAVYGNSVCARTQVL